MQREFYYERLTESETETLLTDYGIPLWAMDQARITPWHGPDGERLEYDRGTGFYWAKGL